MKVVINTCHGGFWLSHDATLALIEAGAYAPCVIASGDNPYNEMRDCTRYGPCVGHRYDCESSRTTPDLIRLIESWGSKRVSGPHSKLKIVEIPDDVEWHVSEYDGVEHVAENHRTWS